jgi:hypothetical protein
MRKDLIESYIRQLSNSFGLKKPVDDEKLLALHQARDYYGMVGVILAPFTFSIKFNLGLVNSGGPADTPAWILIPKSLPMYGTADFAKAEVTMYLRKSFLAEASFEAVVSAVAHEASHVLLDSTMHSLRRQEVAVDLTAMLFGYRDYFVTGCITKLNGRPHRMSYLTQEEISHAAWFMTYGQ